jgi:MFS family permease
MTNGAGTISDMIVQEKRGAAIAGFAIGPLLGPIIGPVVGGLVTDARGWRWTFWVLAIISGFLTISCFLFLRESYAPILLERKARRLRKETGNAMLRSRLDDGLGPSVYFKRGITRPFKMLFFSPICIVCGLYIGLAYSYLYLLFTSLTPLFMRIYHFNVIHAGLTFLGLGIGTIIGVAFFSSVSDRYIRAKVAEENAAAAAERRAAGEMKPEWRLPPIKIGAVIMPIGFFIYGWTAQYEVHWIAPLIGCAVIGFGNIIVFMV